MKQLKAFLILFLLSSSIAFAASEKQDVRNNEKPDPLAEDLGSRGGFGPQDEEFVDPKVLRDFIESRGLINCRQKCGTLTIAGDVRARWIPGHEYFKGTLPERVARNIALNTFKSEFNLFLDYTTDNSWVTTKLKFVVVDAVDPPNALRTELDRAFLGYDIYECGDEDFYIEIGRARIDYLFDSKIEFSTLFNGIHLYYTNKFPGIGTFTLHGGPFIVDSFNDHFAYVAEAGFKDIVFKGFSFRYNIIDWFRHSGTTIFSNQKRDEKEPKEMNNNPRYRFLVSQLLFGYERNIDVFGCKVLFLYAAVLANHLAQKSLVTDHTYANKAWYAGFTLGKLCKAGDWSLDINYQSCAAQAVPEFDLSGIGHGNASNRLLSDSLIKARNHRVGPREGVGFTNYRGFQLSAIYALTDTFSFRAKAEWTQPVNPRIGGNFRYKDFEMAAIYAF